jgi:TonB family protein
MIPIDVRVQVDAHGKVTAATPVTKQHSGLETYLATCAVKAARLWRFEPAREGGQPAPGSTTIHFVFEK